LACRTDFEIQDQKQVLIFRSPFKSSIPLLLLVLLHVLPAGAEHFQRQVLGIYSSAEGKTLEFNPLRQQVEMVLHYLGLHLDYHDIAAGLPPSAQMQNYRGVVVWLESDEVQDVEAYWTWLGQQLRGGRRVVLLNDVGPRFDATTGHQLSLAKINETLALMGLRAGNNYSNLPLDIELVRKVPEMVEFERSLVYELTRFHEVESISPRNQVFLKLRMKSTGAFADAVVLTPNGGFVGEGYLRYVDSETFKKQWRIDPFAFLSQTLGVEDSPRPDCTTLNGNRIYYSHIDGDGLINMSLMDRNSASGEQVFHHILQDYPDLPFTVSVIVVDVEEEVWGSVGSMELARRIFRLPNVEPASHTYSHPLVWNRELVFRGQIEQYAVTMKTAIQSGRAVLPWRIEDYTFSPEKETVWTCRYIAEKLLPPGKECRILLWTGNCLPDEEALSICARAGLLNMNGGDSRLDGEYPSFIYVAPLYRQVGPYYQIHSSNSNENTYTRLWTGPYGGYQNAIQTFENTESPRRVLPINVYYHFYSGERQASLLALKKVYEWVVDQKNEIFPVYASRFIDVVHGFISTRIERLERRSWRIRENGQCRTVRFDDCPLYPDLERSTGILGFRHYQNCLYISLDESREHVIRLVDAPPLRPYLRRATADVLDLHRGEDGSLRFRSETLNQATYVWSNLAAEVDFSISIKGKKQAAMFSARTDATGTLRVSLPLRGGATIAVIPTPGKGSG